MTIAAVTRAAVALLLALALWLVVSSDERAGAWVPVHVSLTVEGALTLAEPLVPVRAFVVGRRQDLFRLVRRPMVLRQRLDASTPGVTRVELPDTALEMPVGMDARVREVQPRWLTVRLAAR